MGRAIRSSLCHCSSITIAGIALLLVWIQASLANVARVCHRIFGGFASSEIEISEIEISEIEISEIEISEIEISEIDITDIPQHPLYPAHHSNRRLHSSPAGLDPLPSRRVI